MTQTESLREKIEKLINICNLPKEPIEKEINKEVVNSIIEEIKELINKQKMYFRDGDDDTYIDKNDLLQSLEGE